MSSDQSQDQRFKDLFALSLCQKIHETLSAHGGVVKFVGGIIRDRMAGHPLPQYPDIDMAMTMHPQQAMDLLTEAGLRVIPTGLDHGTITVFERHDDRLKVELTTLRVDLSTDGRHAEVAFTEDWQGDAERRDFTINAIYLGFDGVIYDPFHGVDDLKQGRVRFIGDAEARIKEDYLRMLRFFRFHARFAKTAPDPAAMAAISQHAASLETISGERIASELGKLIMLPHDGLIAMASTKLDQVLTASGFDLEKLSALHNVISNPSIAARYAALIKDVVLSAFMEKLKLSNAMRQAISYLSTPIAHSHEWTAENWCQHAWPLVKSRNASWWQPAYLAERYALAQISNDSRPDHALLTALSDWAYPTLPITGQDLLDAGFQAGEKIGVILSTLETYWVSHDFTPTKSDLLSMAQRLDLGDVTE